MKILFSFSFLLLILGAPAKASQIYAVGFSYVNNVPTAGYWLNQTWHELPRIVPDTGSGASSVYVSNGNVYIAGTIANTNKVTIAGYWLNGVWNTLPSIDETKGSGADSIKVINGHVYVSGSSANSSNVQQAVTWIDGVLKAEESLDSTLTSYAGSIDIDSSGHVYAGGFSQTPNGSLPNDNAGYWLDGVWKDLPASGNDSVVNGLQFVNGHVYAGGFAYTTPTYWIDGVATSLPIVTNYDSGDVQSLVVSNGHVYASGIIESSHSGNMIGGYWLDGVWNPLSTPVPGSAAQSIFVTSDGTVYAGGYIFYSTANITPCYWVNNTLVELPKSGPFGNVNAIAVEQ